MPNENIIKLAEALSSIGFQIDKFERSSEPLLPYGDFYGNIELLLCLPSSLHEPLLKGNIIQLFDIFSSLGFGIFSYNPICRDHNIYFKFVLYYLTIKT